MSDRFSFIDVDFVQLLVVDGFCRSHPNFTVLHIFLLVVVDLVLQIFLDLGMLIVRFESFKIFFMDFDHIIQLIQG
jgi:hypothetical protein